MQIITVYDEIITTALTAEVGEVIIPSNKENSPFEKPLKGITAVITFAYGSGGTTAKLWLQTSLDGGATWIDIASTGDMATTSGTKIVNLTDQTAITTSVAPTDGTGTTNISGIIGDRFRCKVTTTGTYGGSTTFKAIIIPRY